MTEEGISLLERFMANERRKILQRRRGMLPRRQ